MKIPRDCTGKQLSRALDKFGYAISRQSGSHIVMATRQGAQHHLTVPNHRPIKIGAMQQILKDVAAHLRLTVAELLRELGI